MGIMCRGKVAARRHLMSSYMYSGMILSYSCGIWCLCIYHLQLQSCSQLC